MVWSYAARARLEDECRELLKEIDRIALSTDVNGAKWGAGYSGTCLIKSANEVIFSSATGFANRAFAIPNQLDTKFDAASVTKTFTAIATLMLVEQDLLGLDDNIVEVIDLGGTRIPSDVTIQTLLNHTSGIADDADEEAGEDYSALFVDKPNYSIRECKDFLPQFAYKQPNFKAGTNVRYNNCAFILLGLAIEKITGVSYRDFVCERIFKACGMHHTLFCSMDEVNPNTAEGYTAVTDKDGSFSKWKKNIYAYPPIGTPDGGAYTTVGDLDVFIRAIKSGVLLSPKYSDMMLMPHCMHTRPHKYGTWKTGYAFEFIEANDGEIFCIYKEGVNAGVDAMLSYYPQLDISVNMLSNQNGPLSNIYHEIQAYLHNLGGSIW